jgi:uncharacterized protein involved in exopolysaccharide biosynthesis
MDAMPVPRQAPPSFHEFACHLRARRGQALATFGCVLAAAMIGAALLPPSYLATATLAVLPAPEYTVREAAGSHALNASALALDQIMKAETAILGSDDLHAATLHKLGEAAFYPHIFGPETPNPALHLLETAVTHILSPWRVTPTDLAAAKEERGLKKFGDDLNVLPTKDANIITVSLKNPDATLAAAGVNTLLGFYAARRSRLYNDPQLEVVRRTVTAAAAAVTDADRRLAAYKQAHGISDDGQQRDLLLHRLSQAQQATDDAYSALSEQQARVASLSQALRGESSVVMTYREQDADTRLQAVNGSLQDLQAKLAAARQKYLDGSKVVTMLNAQIGAEQAEAARLDKNPVPSVLRQGRNPNLDQIRLERTQSLAEFAAAEARWTAGRAQIDQIQALLNRLDEAEVGFLDLQRRRAAAEDDFTSASRILADRHLSESEEMLRLTKVRVIQPALVPQSQRPIPLLVIAAGFVFGVFAAFGRVVLAYTLYPVFFTSEGLEQATGIPVLAVFAREAELAA